MSLSVGIVGLPNAGKSTLFNALAARRLAETAARPFTTIEPHEAVVPVPDERLRRLSGLVIPQETVPATVTFIDIAGLVKGAHQGEGLGNQFLAKIREVDALVHVVRAFVDPGVSHTGATHEPGSAEQIIEDIENVNMELELGGIAKRPTIYVLNIGEQNVGASESQRLTELVEGKFGNTAIAVSAKLEEELIDLAPDERKQYLAEVGAQESGLIQIIKRAYELLSLVTFYTIKGGVELHAWSIKQGESALQAAAKVHSDFAKGFIKAEVIGVEELLGFGGPASTRGEEPASQNLGESTQGGWKAAKEHGKVRLEGRDYAVADGDVIEFKVGG